MLRRQVAHHGIVDLEHAGDLVERLAVGLEHDQVVDALRLLRNLVGEPAAAPGVVAAPRAAGTFNELADAGDQVVLPRLGELGVQHEQNLVRRHWVPIPPLDKASHGLSRPRLPAPLGTERRDDGAGSGDQCSKKHL